MAPANGLAQEPLPELAGSGEDLVQLTRRVDLRLERVADGDSDELTLTLRLDHRVPLGEMWQLNLRADAPFTRVNKGDEPTESGRGDMLVQAVLARRFSSGEGIGFGAQVIFPTGVEHEERRGNWRLRPVIGYRWPARRITEESFFQLLIRYEGSFAGSEDRPDTREIQVSPNLEIALPHRFYVSLFPSADFRYDFVHDELFVPVNMEIGKEWGRLVWSVEGASGVIRGDHAPYDWRIETRLGLRF